MDYYYIFKDIKREDVDKMLKCFGATTRFFKKDSIIMSYINNAGVVGVVIDGEVSISRKNANGESFVVVNLTSGDVFGEVFSNFGFDDLYARAVCDTSIVFIDYFRIINQCKKACECHGKMIANLFEVLSSRVNAYSERIEVLSRRTIRDKVLTYFEILARKSLSRSFVIPFSYTEFANYLGVDRAAMTREISNLKEDGLIFSEGRKITLKYWKRTYFVLFFTFSKFTVLSFLSAFFTVTSIWSPRWYFSFVFFPIITFWFLST